jgi:hypothetical protein
MMMHKTKKPLSTKKDSHKRRRRLIRNKLMAKIIDEVVDEQVTDEELLAELA